jgi:hypothetical protein
MSGYRSGGNPNRLVTKVNTAGETSIGTASLTGGSTSSAYGQVSASLAAETIVTQATVTLASGSFPAIVTLEIAYGGAGSESIVASLPVIGNSTAASRGVVTPRIPVKIAAGQRLAVRITDGTVTGNLNTVSGEVVVYGMPTGNLETN